MKKIFAYILILSATAAFSTSCDDVLNIDPTDRYSYASVWGSQESVDQYVFGFYSILKESSEISNSNMAGFTDAYSDIIKNASWDQYNHTYNYALLMDTYFSSSHAGCHECWSYCYEKIRRHNEFLRDAPGFADKLGHDFVTIRTAEVRFMRAFAYYRLIRVYGGVVLRTSVDGPDQNDKPRSTEEESWDQVIEDLTFAAENLPVSWDESGRVTKAAAYGMLSRVALFAKNWELAVSAADECAKYASLDSSYSNVFASSSSVENILVVNFLPGYLGQGLSHNADIHFRPVGDGAYHNNKQIYSTFAPTSELVDSYEMADGTDFSWKQHGEDPYKGREPRFYASILYNGAKWEGREIETFVGGVDGFMAFRDENTATSTTTGYYLKKWITEEETSWETKASSHFFIMIRYAEVLLNKAEALAELGNGRLPEALESLNQVRARVGLPAKTASTKAEFMKLLRKERMVELAGEGFRFWDIRRWRIAGDDPNVEGDGVIHGAVAHGVKITKDPETGKCTYEHVEVDAGRTRIFLDHYYAFSIPVEERSNNNLFGQNNPGW